MNNPTARKVYFKNSWGDPLCGILSPAPEGFAGLMVILCHGFATGKDGRTYITLEELLNAQGFSTLRFDFFGHGESAGSLGDITISEALDDVLRARDFVIEAGYIEIGLLGSSFGGLASILAAAQWQSDDLVFLALKSPVSDYLSRLIALRDDQQIAVWKTQGYIPVSDMMKQRTHKLKYSFYLDAEKIRGYEAAERIAAPTLIVHGDADESVPVEQSRELARRISDCRLEVIPNADHRYSRPQDFNLMLQKLMEFMLQFK